MREKLTNFARTTLAAPVEINIQENKQGEAEVSNLREFSSRILGA